MGSSDRSHLAPRHPQHTFSHLIMNRRGALLGLSVMASALGGCASTPSLRCEVTTFGQWPTGLAPGSFIFDRLPSQQANPQATMALESLVRPALVMAGFAESATVSSAQFLVQSGARTSRATRAPWDDPLWWRGGANFRSWGHPGWAHRWRADAARYEREVALLLRDRASGSPLYEARATSEGYTSSSAEVLSAMFVACLQHFPEVFATPKTVVVPLGGRVATR